MQRDRGDSLYSSRILQLGVCRSANEHTTRKNQLLLMSSCTIGHTTSSMVGKKHQRRKGRQEGMKQKARRVKKLSHFSWLPTETITCTFNFTTYRANETVICSRKKDYTREMFALKPCCNENGDPHGRDKKRGRSPAGRTQQIRSWYLPTSSEVTKTQVSALLVQVSHH